jgi:hypothetical protein
LASKKRKHQEAETEPVEKAIQEDGDQEGKEKKKCKETEDPVVDADGEKKMKRKSKESEEPAVVTAEGEKKKFDVASEDVAMQTKKADEKDKKKFWVGTPCFLKSNITGHVVCVSRKIAMLILVSGPPHQVLAFMSAFGLISFCLLDTCVIETISTIKFIFYAKLMDLCIVEH